MTGLLWPKQETPPVPQVESGAELSGCLTYRWRLWRRNLLGSMVRRPGYVCWGLLNPSDADWTKNDPTVWQVTKFTMRWGFDAFEIVNAYPYRSPSPENLARWVGHERFITVEKQRFWEAMDENRRRAIPVAKAATIFIAGWGNKAPDGEAIEFRLALEREGVLLHHLGLTKDGNPKHPMARGTHRIPDDQEPIEWT